MIRTLKGYSMKVMLPKIVALFCVALILFGVSAMGIVMLLGGATPVSQLDWENSTGEYVSFDASEIIVAVATLSSSKGDGKTQVMETHYLLPSGDGRYLCVVDYKEKNSSVLTRAMEQSQQYYMADLETLTRLGDLKGTVKPLDDSVVSYMTDCIDNYQLPGYVEGESSMKLILERQIELNQVGYLSETVALALCFGGVLFAVAGLALLLPVVTGTYQKKALEGIDPEEIEAAFANAEVIEQVHVGAYIFYQKGAATKRLQTSELIWGYAMPEPLVVSKYRWPVALYTREQEMVQVCFMEKKSCEKFLNAIKAQGHPFISGYTSDYAQLFQNNFEKFLAEAEK